MTSASTVSANPPTSAAASPPQACPSAQASASSPPPDPEPPPGPVPPNQRAAGSGLPQELQLSGGTECARPAPRTRPLPTQPHLSPSRLRATKRSVRGQPPRTHPRRRRLAGPRAAKRPVSLFTSQRCPCLVWISHPEEVRLFSTPRVPTGRETPAQGRSNAKALGSHDHISPRPNGAREPDAHPASPRRGLSLYSHPNGVRV